MSTVASLAFRTSMKVVAVPLLVATLLSACASNPALSRADLTEPQQVSVPALLGRAVEFDGQAVRVMGVARFAPGAEGRTAIYATANDQRRSSSSYITIASLSPALAASPGALVELTGKSVVIEGTFQARPLNRIPERPGLVFACTGDCLTSGALQDVTRVDVVEN